jgi:hypothetical protein
MKRKSSRAVAMSHAMKLIKAANPSMPQTQILAVASKQLSGRGIPKLIKGYGLNLAPQRGSGMYLKPYG